MVKTVRFEIGGGFPWFRRVPPPPLIDPVLGPKPVEPHKSWVKVRNKVGWLHHHEVEGWVVEFRDGTRSTTNNFTHISPPA